MESKASKFVLGFSGLATLTETVLVPVAISRVGQDRGHARAWFLAVAIVFALTLGVYIIVYGLYPLTVRLDARSRRIRAATSIVPGHTSLVIDKALYGVKGHWVDVLTAVASAVSTDGHLNLLVTTGTLGIADPAPNSPKSLQVSYLYKGERYDKGFEEGEFAVLP